MYNIEEANHSSIGRSIRFHLRKFLNMHVDTNYETIGLYMKTIHETEKALIMETLSYTNNVQSKAAKVLGINRNTLRKKMQELGLSK